MHLGDQGLGANTLNKHGRSLFDGKNFSNTKESYYNNPNYMCEKESPNGKTGRTKFSVENTGHKGIYSATCDQLMISGNKYPRNSEFCTDKYDSLHYGGEPDLSDANNDDCKTFIEKFGNKIIPDSTKDDRLDYSRDRTRKNGNTSRRSRKSNGFEDYAGTGLQGA